MKFHFLWKIDEQRITTILRLREKSEIWKNPDRIDRVWREVEGRVSRVWKVNRALGTPQTQSRPEWTRAIRQVGNARLTGFESPSSWSALWPWRRPHPPSNNHGEHQEAHRSAYNTRKLFYYNNNDNNNSRKTQISESKYRKILIIIRDIHTNI